MTLARMHSRSVAIERRAASTAEVVLRCQPHARANSVAEVNPARRTFVASQRRSGSGASTKRHVREGAHIRVVHQQLRGGGVERERDAGEQVDADRAARGQQVVHESSRAAGVGRQACRRHATDLHPAVEIPREHETDRHRSPSWFRRAARRPTIRGSLLPISRRSVGRQRAGTVAIRARGKRSFARRRGHPITHGTRAPSVSAAAAVDRAQRCASRRATRPRRSAIASSVASVRATCRAARPTSVPS